MLKKSVVLKSLKDCIPKSTSWHNHLLTLDGPSFVKYNRQKNQSTTRLQWNRKRRTENALAFFEVEKGSEGMYCQLFGGNNETNQL